MSLVSMDLSYSRWDCGIPFFELLLYKKMSIKMGIPSSLFDDYLRLNGVFSHFLTKISHIDNMFGYSVVEVSTKLIVTKVT